MGTTSFWTLPPPLSCVVCDVVAETTLRSVNNDEMVTDVDESTADRASAEQRLSCILCMESIDSTDRLQQHLLMVDSLPICSVHRSNLCYSCYNRNATAT